MLTLLALATPVDPALPPPAVVVTALPFGLIVAMLVDTIGVATVVWALTTYVFPAMRERVPWVVPAFATFLAGPVLAILQNSIGAWLGATVDLGLIGSTATGLATGAFAVVGHQTVSQQQRVAKAAGDPMALIAPPPNPITGQPAV
jgi:hypothetical protein